MLPQSQAQVVGVLRGIKWFKRLDMGYWTCMGHGSLDIGHDMRLFDYSVNPDPSFCDFELLRRGSLQVPSLEKFSGGGGGVVCLIIVSIQFLTSENVNMNVEIDL